MHLENPFLKPSPFRGATPTLSSFRSYTDLNPTQHVPSLASSRLTSSRLNYSASSSQFVDVRPITITPSYYDDQKLAELKLNNPFYKPVPNIGPPLPANYYSTNQYQGGSYSKYGSGTAIDNPFKKPSNPGKQTDILSSVSRYMMDNFVSSLPIENPFNGLSKASPSYYDEPRFNNEPPISNPFEKSRKLGQNQVPDPNALANQHRTSRQQEYNGLRKSRQEQYNAPISNPFGDRRRADNDQGPIQNPFANNRREPDDQVPISNPFNGLRKSHDQDNQPLSNPFIGMKRDQDYDQNQSQNDDYGISRVIGQISRPGFTDQTIKIQGKEYYKVEMRNTRRF